MNALKRGTVGIEMGVSVAVGYGIGVWLDDYFETKPWLTFTFLMLGVAAGFRTLFRLAAVMAKEDEKLDDNQDRQGG